MGAEHRNPRLLPRSIAGGGECDREKDGGGQEKKVSPHLPWLLFIGNGTPSCTVPPLLWHPVPPTPVRESQQVASPPGPTSKRLSEPCQPCWESTGRANQPWKLHVPSRPTRRWLCKHVAGHVWGLRGLMATCRSPSECPSCPWMSRGTHLHCSWEETFIQDNTDG